MVDESHLSKTYLFTSVNVTLPYEHAKKFFMVTRWCLLTTPLCLTKLVYNPYIVSSLVNVQRKPLVEYFCIYTNRQKCGWMNSSNSTMDGWSIKMLLIVLKNVYNVKKKEWQMPWCCNSRASLKICIPINCLLGLDLLPCDFTFLCCVLSLRDYLNDDTVGTACAFLTAHWNLITSYFDRWEWKLKKSWQNERGNLRSAV